MRRRNDRKVKIGNKEVKKPEKIKEKREKDTDDEIKTNHVKDHK